jgi:hypothetical protein
MVLRRLCSHCRPISSSFHKQRLWPQARTWFRTLHKRQVLPTDMAVVMVDQVLRVEYHPYHLRRLVCPLGHRVVRLSTSTPLRLDLEDRRQVDRLLALGRRVTDLHGKAPLE